jgi:hypothetical protein
VDLRAAAAGAAASVRTAGKQRGSQNWMPVRVGCGLLARVPPLMPFSNKVPQAFTPSSVRFYAPAVPGIYGLSNALHWVYIAYADDIRNALMQHLKERGTTLALSEPSGFVFEVCEAASQAGRCDRLIAEYAPRCNQPAPVKGR